MINEKIIKHKRKSLYNGFLMLLVFTSWHVPLVIMLPECPNLLTCYFLLEYFNFVDDIFDELKPIHIYKTVHVPEI